MNNETVQPETVQPENKGALGLPIIKSICISLSSHPSWRKEAARATEITNDFIFDAVEETIPPRVVLSGCDLYVPAYGVIADTLIRAMLRTDCNPAMVLLILRALEEIENFDPWKIALLVAEECCQIDSARL